MNGSSSGTAQGRNRLANHVRDRAAPVQNE
jgi:hypothetical protein